MHSTWKTSHWPSGTDRNVRPVPRKTLAMTLYAALFVYTAWAAFGSGF